MSKKKQRLTKKQRQQLKKLSDRVGVPLVGLVVGLAIGALGMSMSIAHRSPRNLVWAADASVKVPSDLRHFLLTQNDCQQYKGTGSPTGVALWGVYQVTNNTYAKISYGCSINLNLYILAIKQKGQWSLLQPTAYFASVDTTSGNGYLPKCEVLAKYKIPKTIESFCVEANGQGRANTL